MKAKCKKLMSAAVVSAIIAAQTLMPVAAAGGEYEVGVTTKTAPIRVMLPTSMEIAVDQFMMGGAGSQISSDAFTMENMSQIPVKVAVTSIAELGAKTKLVSTKKAAEDSTDKTNNEAWIAAVTQTSSGNYTETAVDGSKDVDALTGTEENITAFKQGTGANAAKGTAVQNFYLDKGTAGTSKLFKATTNSKDEVKNLSYAQFYELTAQADPAGVPGLQSLVNAGDVYYVATASIADAVALTKINKGATVQTSDYANTNTYYTVATAETAPKDMLADATKLYVYGDGTKAATGGEAAFRYIGALSSTKDSWDATDLTKVIIKYDITGISTDSYDEMKDDLQYGYKAETSKFSITAEGLLTMQGVSADVWKSGFVTFDGQDYEMNSGAGTWETKTDPAEFKFSSAWMSRISGNEITIKVTLQDNTVIEETLTVPAS